MTHYISSFSLAGAYRGMSCTCGFTASTGNEDEDRRHITRHLDCIRNGIPQPVNPVTEVQAPDHLRHRCETTWNDKDQAQNGRG